MQRSDNGAGKFPSAYLPPLGSAKDIAPTFEQQLERAFAPPPEPLSKAELHRILAALQKYPAEARDMARILRAVQEGGGVR
jgi:hypothetical protein